MSNAGGISKAWKGAIVGALIGCATLVFTGPFKGNLGEQEFLAEYIGYLIPTTVIGALIGWRKQRQETPEQPIKKSRTFLLAITVLSLGVVGKVAIDFPNGEGLFYPTRAANVAEADKVCLQKLAADTTNSQEAKEIYCSCWADQVAHATETDSPPLTQLQASPSLAKEFEQKIDAVCRQQR
jgi:hypothetical protein